jgi:hypothetical protein
MMPIKTAPASNGMPQVPRLCDLDRRRGVISEIKSMPATRAAAVGRLGQPRRSMDRCRGLTGTDDCRPVGNSGADTTSSTIQTSKYYENTL